MKVISKGPEKAKGNKKGKGKSGRKGGDDDEDSDDPLAMMKKLAVEDDDEVAVRAPAAGASRSVGENVSDGLLLEACPTHSQQPYLNVPLFRSAIELALSYPFSACTYCYFFMLWMMLVYGYFSS